MNLDKWIEKNLRGREWHFEQNVITLRQFLGTWQRCGSVDYFICPFCNGKGSATITEDSSSWACKCGSYGSTKIKLSRSLAFAHDRRRGMTYAAIASIENVTTQYIKGVIKTVTNMGVKI